jgi:hypothetical protein
MLSDMVAVPQPWAALSAGRGATLIMVARATSSGGSYSV